MSTATVGRKLAVHQLVAFLTTSNAARAKEFFGGTLGLRLVSEDQFAVVFDANGTSLRISITRGVTPAQHTVLGWEVSNIEEAIHELREAGVKFERFEGMMQQDALGIWAAPGGTKVAWFKDPDGNLLSLSQHS